MTLTLIPLLRFLVRLLVVAAPITMAIGQEDGPTGEELVRLAEVRRLEAELEVLSPEGDQELARVHEELTMLFEELAGELDQGVESTDLDRALIRGASVLRAPKIAALSLPTRHDEWCRIALKSARRSNDLEAQVTISYEGGDYLDTVGRNDLARALWKEATELDHESQPFIVWSLAASYRADEQWPEAHFWLGEAEKAGRAQELGDRFSFFLQGEWFLYHLELGLLDLAQQDLQEEEELAAELVKDPYVQWTYRVHRLEYLLVTDEFEEAVLLADEFIENPLGAGSSDRFLFQRGVSLSERSRLDSRFRENAIASFEEALELARSNQGGGLGEMEQLDIELGVLQLMLEDGDREGAAVWLEQVDDHLEDLRRIGSEVRPILLVQRDILAGALAVTGDAPRDVKERALQEMRSAYDRVLGEWRSVPPHPSGTGFLLLSGTRLVLEHLLHATLSVEEAPRAVDRALEELMRAQALGSLARRLEAPAAPSIAEVRERLIRPRHGLLVYYPSAVRGLVFAVDAERTEVAELDSWLKLRRARSDFLERDADRPHAVTGEGQPSDEAKELARLLIPESLHPTIAEWEAVTVVGLDLLGWVPLACLPFPGERPLGLELAVDTVPSLPLALHLAEREAHRRPTGEILFLGAPIPNPEVGARYRFEDLSSRVQQGFRETLLEATAGRSLRIVVEREATRARLRADELEGVALLHILTHGIFNPLGDDPNSLRDRPAGLMLAPEGGGDDGLLWCRDVERLSAMPPVVLLSACGAGRGQLRLGDDGVSHLGGAFLSAGARAVLISHADLDYDATLALTTYFTEHFARGDVSPARALQLARLDLVTEHPEWAHPYYHGSLQVLGIGQFPVAMLEGQGDVPERSRWRSPLTLVGVVIGVALAVGGVRARRRRHRCAVERELE